MFAVLAVFMQTLVPHKTLGWMLMLVFVVAQITLDRLGFEHNLYQYAGRPPSPLSDMNGQGDFARFGLWFRAYWTAGRRAARGAVLRALARAASARRCARAWRCCRGACGARRARWPRSRPSSMAVLGGWIFYNTNVLNEYQTTLDREARPGRLREGADRLRERCRSRASPT